MVNNLLVFIYSFLYSTDLWAYIDPASGSFIISLLISGLVFLKVFWYKLKKLIN